MVLLAHMYFSIIPSMHDTNVQNDMVVYRKKLEVYQWAYYTIVFLCVMNNGSTWYLVIKPYFPNCKNPSEMDPGYDFKCGSIHCKEEYINYHLHAVFYISGYSLN